MQKCLGCKLELSDDNFYRDTRYTYHLKPRCKKCLHEKYRQDYTTKNQISSICQNCKKLFKHNSNYCINQKFCSMKCFGSSKAFLDYNISTIKETQDWIDGFMLGDISIDKYSRFTFNVKHLEFSKFIASKLEKFKPNIYPYKGRNIWSCRTKTHPDIKNERQRWYPAGKKIVPKDAIINRNSLSALYLSDGSIEKRGAISIWTLSFTEEENLFLVNKIKELIPDIENIKVSYVRREGKCQSYLFFPRIEAIKFLRFLGKSDVECYKYKFLIRHTGENFHEA